MGSVVGPAVRIDEPTNARSRRTREALLDAAREILERDGFHALTMGAVAHRAEVSRGAVYLHFSSRSDVVAALFDHIAAREGLSDSLRRVRDAPDAVAALDEWAAHLARYHPRMIAVDRAITHVQHDDPDAAAHRRRVDEAQREGCTHLARRLADEGRLAEPWTVATARDMLFALISTDMIERLTVGCGWSERRLADRLATLFRATFTRRDGTGAPG